MRCYFKLLLPLLFLVSSQIVSACPGHERQKGHHCHGGIFQFSTISALMVKYLDGGMSFQRLSRKGDFGLGTFNGLDGEMIALDGQFFQIKDDGKAYSVSAEAKTPFATVLHFAADKTLRIPQDLSYEGVQQFLTKEASPGNHIQAIRIDGRFKQLTVRSVPKQKHPYRKLAEITKTDMKTFDYKNIEGTLVGFKFPDYMEKLNVTGYHFHFIDKDRKLGGNVLSLISDQANASVQTTRRFKMLLPGDDDFNLLDLNQDQRSDLEAVEKGSVNDSP